MKFKFENPSVGGCPVCGGEMGFHEAGCPVEKRQEERRQSRKKKKDE